MRNLPTIRQLWTENDGKFLGDKKPMGRVTVEPAWQLNLTGQTYGSSEKGPYRWVQRADAARTEVEVPNIKSITIDRAIDKDAGSCTIVMYNQYHQPAGSVDPTTDTLGKPGYYGYNYGNSQESGRFGDSPNAWQDILIPNALLRTYQGYGGWEFVGDNFQAKPLTTAVSQGYITLTGTWLIDRVTLGTNGLITMTCRDMAKLLIDQSVFIPLVPDRYYPLKYSRYVTEDIPYEPGRAGEPSTPGGEPLVGILGTGQVRHRDSSSRRWNGTGNVGGTLDTSVWDQKEETYSISSGSSHWNNSWAKDWWEADVGDEDGATINSIYVSAYGGAESGMPFVDGGYWMWISIMEDGQWSKGTSINPATNNVIPWDDANNDGKPDTLVASMGAGNVPILNTDINYVLFTSTQNGSATYDGEWYQLDRSYQAQRIRITLTPLWRSVWGPNYYRSGLRQVRCQLLNVNPTGSTSGSTPAVAGGWVTRGDAIAIIHDFAGSPTGSPWSGFSDITANRHVEAVNWAKEFGITTGTSPTTFTPNRAITRAEFVVMLYRAADSPVGAPPHPFADIQQAWQEDAVDWAYTTGLTTGTSSDTFSPDIPVTPHQVSLFMSRYGDAIGLPNNIPSFWDLEIEEETDGGVVDLPDPVLLDGNLRDWLDPVVDLLLWSGFLLHDPVAAALGGPAQVNGVLEYANSWPEGEIGEDVFDKKTVIDSINTIKEVLGYILWIDETGGIRFHAPNWMRSGNWIEGTDKHGNAMHELTDQKTITDYSSTYTDDLVRSEIILGNIPLDEESYANGESNVHVDPNSLFDQDLLRGMTKPAIWLNEVFTEPEEQKLMAALIGLHLMFQSKTGQVTALANPEVQIDDQIRITERVSSESYIHYIRGLRTTMDLDTGSYLMTLTTNWLGDESTWAYDKEALLALYTARRTEGAGQNGNENITQTEQIRGPRRGQTGNTNDIPGVDPGTDQAGQ